MADLISRAAAISEIDEYLQGLDSCISEPDLKLDGYRNGLQVAIQELKALPAVEDVPVVRCKECMYWKSDMLTHFWKPCDVVKTDKDWYCPCGKRR